MGRNDTLGQRGDEAAVDGILDGMAEALWHRAFLQALGGRMPRHADYPDVPQAADMAADDLWAAYDDAGEGPLETWQWKQSTKQRVSAHELGEHLAKEAFFDDSVVRGMIKYDQDMDELSWEFRVSSRAAPQPPVHKVAGGRRNPGEKFKVGDIVKRTAATMRSMGIVSGPVNGVIVGYSGRFPLVRWSDMTESDEPMPQAEVALELARKRKNPTKPRDLKNLLNRAAAALETPMDLNATERLEVIEDLVVAAEAVDSDYQCNASPSGPADSAAARELVLYIDNDADLHRQMMVPIRTNLMKKRKAGTYDSQKAVVAWMHMVDAGAKKYVKEFGSGGRIDTVFNRNTRLEAARDLAQAFEAEADLGNYDNLVKNPCGNPAGLWSEVGLEDATVREKADFWRRDLLDELEQEQLHPIRKDLAPQFAVILPDISGVLMDEPSLEEIQNAIHEQIQNASPAQIVGYAESYYARH